MVGTRGVLAVMAGITMVAALVALRTGRKPLGLWLLTAGFVIASLWSGLSFVWTRENAGAVSSDSHLLLGSTAVAGAVYYGMLAKESNSKQ
ncbi:hypothetical protein [Haladaptatus caseinilyticus]|uniref:hypothetical protein n=1 Tax=Haladaptatus caseinilyticus TaxID=2993314 RepID=UPI00224ADAEE|nr:hypothetical protein [Haladaptatus caseinilyticus]